MRQVKLTILLQAALSLQTVELSLKYRTVPKTRDILFRIRQAGSFCKYETSFDYGRSFLDYQSR